MRSAPDAWTHLTPARLAGYAAFLLDTMPRLAAVPLPWPARSHWWRTHAVLRRALRAASYVPGIALEFGVYRGVSMRLSACAQPARKFFGFDSFEGFPADARPDWQLDFATLALPAVPANVMLLPGWFADTLPRFLAEHPSPIAFVNIDCDLYSSTATVLEALDDRLTPGTVVYFDELLNYDTFLWNELLALWEFLEPRGLDVAWIAVDHRVRDAPGAAAMLEDGCYPEWRADVRAGFGRAAAGVMTRRATPWPLDDPRCADLAATLERLTERLRNGCLVDRYCAPL